MSSGEKGKAPASERGEVKKGRLSDKAAAQLAKMKAESDAAKSGRLSMAEYEAAKAARPPQSLLPGEDPAKICHQCTPADKSPSELDDW